MHAGEKKKKRKNFENQPMSPKASEDLDMHKLFCLWSKGPGLKCPPLPTLSPSPSCGTPSVVSIYWQL